MGRKLLCPILNLHDCVNRKRSLTPTDPCAVCNQHPGIRMPHRWKPDQPFAKLRSIEMQRHAAERVRPRYPSSDRLQRGVFGGLPGRDIRKHPHPRALSEELSLLQKSLHLRMPFQNPINCRNTLRAGCIQQNESDCRFSQSRIDECLLHPRGHFGKRFFLAGRERRMQCDAHCLSSRTLAPNLRRARTIEVYPEAYRTRSTSGHPEGPENPIAVEHSQPLKRNSIDAHYRCG